MSSRVCRKTPTDKTHHTRQTQDATPLTPRTVGDDLGTLGRSALRRSVGLRCRSAQSSTAAASPSAVRRAPQIRSPLARPLRPCARSSLGAPRVQLAPRRVLRVGGRAQQRLSPECHVPPLRPLLIGLGLLIAAVNSLGIDVLGLAIFSHRRSPNQCCGCAYRAAISHACTSRHPEAERSGPVSHSGDSSLVPRSESPPFVPPRHALPGCRASMSAVSRVHRVSRSDFVTSRSHRKYRRRCKPLSSSLS